MERRAGVGGILVVDDHVLVREAMIRRLNGLRPDLRCAEAASTAEALLLLEADDDFELAIVDLMMPGDNGFALLAVLGQRHPDLALLVVSALDDAATVRRAAQVGASAFVSKAASGEELIAAVQAVLAGGRHLPERRELTSSGYFAIEQGRGRERLTAAQQRVLELLAGGNSNSAIAALLGISVATVKVHVSAIFRVLGVSNRAQTLVALARHDGRL